MNAIKSPGWTTHSEDYEGRLEDAFLISQEQELAIELTSFTEDFLNRHSFIMPEHTGTIISRFNESTETHESLLLDATRQSEGTFVWERNLGSKGTRRIWQITITDTNVHHAQVSGCYAEYNQQGRQVKRQDLTDLETEIEILKIFSEVKSDELEAELAKLHEKKRQSIQDEEDETISNYKKDKLRQINKRMGLTALWAFEI